MNDSERLESLFDTIKKELDQLDVFESEVINRPQSDARDKTLEAIRIERKKLANLANSASQ